MEFSVGEILGSGGVTLLLIAFLMNLLKRWSHEGLAYLMLNTIGAALACASSVVIRFIPFVILEGTWAVVSLIALKKYFTNRQRAQ